MLVRILERLGAEVIPVKRSDRFIAIDTENVTAGDRKLFAELAGEYKQRDLLSIVTTDGDGDRPFIADEKGQLHLGEMVGVVVCQYLKAGFAAVPITANDAVAEQLRRDGVTLKYTKVGSPYVIEAMNQALSRGESSVVGLEVNGGVLTGSDFLINGKLLKSLPTRDAFLPILGVLARATERKTAVSQLFAELPRRYKDAGLLDNFPPEAGRKILEHFLPPDSNIQQVNFEDGAVAVTDFTGRKRALASEDAASKALTSNKAELEEYFNSKLGFASIIAINYMDGLRIISANRDIVHLRPSGNAPQFRVYANASSQERADEIVRLCLSQPDGIVLRMRRSV